VQSQNYYPYMGNGGGPMPGHPGAGGGMMGPPVNESLQIFVPNSAVGAIIGAGGANIKQIMRESGAFVNVSNHNHRLYIQGGHSPGKPGKVGQCKRGQGIEEKSGMVIE